MLRLFIILITCVFVLSACDKYNEFGDLNEAKDTARVHSRLFLLDTITQQALFIPQSKKKIIILPKESKDESNYLYSATTDESGYFTFQHLTRGKEYRLVYNETIGSILYRADTVVTPPFAHLQFIASPSFDKQTGLYFTITDPEGRPIPKGSLCLFSNPEAFQSGKCDKSNFTILTDSYGRGFLPGLKRGTYDYIAAATIGSIEYKATGNFVVSNKVERLEIKLVAPAAVTGVQFTVTDPSGFAVNGARVCLFQNEDFFKQGSCEGSQYSDSTKSNGKVVFSNLPLGTYYARATLTVNNRPYSAASTLTLNTGEFKNEPLTVR